MTDERGREKSMSEDLFSLRCQLMIFQDLTVGECRNRVRQLIEVLSVCQRNIEIGVV